jgi:hypothetical protein
MSNELGLGQFITGSKEKDAVHIAVIPLVAGERFYPGDRFTCNSGTDVAMRYSGKDYIGVVDPFLSMRVEVGEKFWGFIKPGTVTGMRHEWQHPAFDYISKNKGGVVPGVNDTSIKINISESEAWIRDFCDQWNFDYNTLIKEASHPGGYIVADGIDLHCAGELGEDHDLFWKHLENVTGKRFNDEHRQDFGWSCSC